MKKLRNIAKKILPHGFMQARHRDTFLDGYDRWKAEGGTVEFDDECIFQTIVSVDGFGCSGSSAVMDLLREYTCCEVWATAPSFTVGGKTVSGLGEFDIMRHTGGLLYLEHMMQDEALCNDFWSDAAVKAFVSLVSVSPIYRDHPEVRKFFYRFFDEIVYQRLPCDVPLVNGYLNPFSSVNDIFTLKQLDRDRYRALCRGLLFSIFNTLLKDSKAAVLVVDHIFGDCGHDMERFLAYLPMAKRIIVRRDIRDVFINAQRSKHQWLAHDSVEEFVKWERKMYWQADNVSPQSLSLRFEDMVKDYDGKVREIEEFLHLPSSCHAMRQKIFCPSVSAGNIGQWKTCYAAECDEIKKNAPELCYGE